MPGRAYMPMERGDTSFQLILLAVGAGARGCLGVRMTAEHSQRVGEEFHPTCVNCYVSRSMRS